MIHLLYGEDDFSISEALTFIKTDGGTSDIQDISTDILRAPEMTFEELVAVSSTVPFLSAKRVVIVDNLFASFDNRTKSKRNAKSSKRFKHLKWEDWKELPNFLPNVPQTTDLIFVEGPLNESNILLKKLRSMAKIHRFPKITGNNLVKWIHDRASHLEVQIKSNDIKLLSETIGGNLRVLSSELQKLSLFRHKEMVSSYDIKTLVSYTREPNIFRAVDSALEGRPGFAMQSIHRIVEEGGSPSMILAMIARQIKLILRTKDLRLRKVSAREIGKRLSLSGYPLSKTFDQEKKMSETHLVAMHQLILEADLKIKSSNVDELTILDILAIRMAQLS